MFSMQGVTSGTVNFIQSRLSQAGIDKISKVVRASFFLLSLAFTACVVGAYCFKKCFINNTPASSSHTTTASSPTSTSEEQMPKPPSSTSTQIVDEVVVRMEPWDYGALLLTTRNEIDHKFASYFPPLESVLISKWFTINNRLTASSYMATNAKFWQSIWYQKIGVIVMFSNAFVFSQKILLDNILIMQEAEDTIKLKEAGGILHKRSLLLEQKQETQKVTVFQLDNGPTIGNCLITPKCLAALITTIIETEVKDKISDQLHCVHLLASSPSAVPFLFVWQAYMEKKKDLTKYAHQHSVPKFDNIQQFALAHETIQELFKPAELS